MTQPSERVAREFPLVLELALQRSPKARMLNTSNPDVQRSNPLRIVQTAAQDPNACFGPDELDKVRRCLRDHGIYLQNRSADLVISDRDAAELKGFVFKSARPTREKSRT